MNKLMKTTLIAAIAMNAGIAAAADGSAGWLLRIGGHYVEPAADNHELVSVGAGESLTFNLTRMIGDHWSVEFLAALPFEHDIALNDGGKVADVKQLPPTLTLQYHFLPTGDVHPYVGAGINATIFFDEHTTGALDGAKLELADSFGPALEAGMDFDVGERWFVNVEARWIDIDARATLNGASLGDVSIDPIAYGLTVGRTF